MLMRAVTDYYQDIIFMKIGRHADETLDSILARKREEFRRTGRTFWGYGGSTCHPLTQVRPFVRTITEQGGRVNLLMEQMNSKANPDVKPATEYSEDGISWKPLPSGIVVTGSRYALVLGEIKSEEIQLPLHRYVVGYGKSSGRSASIYIQGRVDKACLISSPNLPENSKEKMIGITYTAEIIAPYAVLLRSSQLTGKAS